MPRVLNFRTAGLPEGAIYIGRAMPRAKLRRESKWRNPFKLAKQATPEERAAVLAIYECYLRASPKLMAALPELHGCDLVCWCAPEPCHGDLLLSLANPRD